MTVRAAQDANGRCWWVLGPHRVLRSDALRFRADAEAHFALTLTAHERLALTRH